ncbi:MAG: T9SS type A sorting domain-containing protein [Saprospiraceae bacterium]|nr:T9SS type A sorting domain-containing protein [Saprospiraceae bacterium]
MDGHIIKNITLGSSQELNTQDLSRGSYLLKIITPKQIFTKKLVIVR